MTSVLIREKEEGHRGKRGGGRAETEQPWELKHGVHSMIRSEVLQERPQTPCIPHPHLPLTHQRPRNRLGTGELRFGVPCARL